MNEYPFTEWPQQALADRLEFLQEISTIAHGEERQQQVSREISYLIFEFNQRAEEQ
mgnify:CR=1 FL=1